MKENKRAVGKLYEEKAAAYLKDQGLRIIRRNYRVRTGEIDLIAQDGEYLVFVEVKYRSTGKSGCALCAVAAAKQRSISRTAVHYLSTAGKEGDIPCRFDVVGFDGEQVQWVKNAFDYCR